MPIFRVKSHKLRVKKALSSLGYTLIELMVTLTIISILSVFIFANFKDFAKDQVLVRASDQIKTILKQAQTNAQSGVMCDNIQASEWSVKITPLQVKLFCRNINTTTDVLIKTQSFESGINIDNISTKSGDGASICDSSGFSEEAPFSVVYKPIFQKIDFIFSREESSECISTNPHGTGANPLVASKAEIVVNYVRGEESIKKIFRINTGGAIDIQ